jgi:glycosyltransferase involved in cell wall biosynthesis
MMLYVAQGFVKHKFKADIVLQRVEGPDLSRITDDLRIIDLNAGRTVLALIPLIRYLRKEKPQVIISAMMYANVIAIIAKKLARVDTRVIVSEHTTISYAVRNSITLRGRFLPLLARLLYPMSDAIVAVSEGVADDLARAIRLPRGNMHVLYNPVVTPDLDEMIKEPLDHPWFQPGEPPVILGTGRLTHQKDFPTLLRAFAIVGTEQAARLVILGEGRDRSNLQALTKELHIEGCVDMPGFVGNPYKYMAHAAVFVLSSKYEGLPTVLIEALSCGAKVVSTDCESGPREILQGGKYGKLVPVGDVEALANAILRALENRTTLPVSRSEALLPFTLDTAVRKYIQLFSELNR